MSMLVFIATAVVVPVLVAEGTDWLPWVARWLTRRATRMLPPETRQRYAEEWQAEVDALPGGSLTKVVFGIRVFIGAHGTGAALRETGAARQMTVKSVLDRIVAGVAVLAVLPTLAAIVVLIRMTSPGPVLVRQRRVGRDGVVFNLLKFRTTHYRAEEHRPASLSASGNHNLSMAQRSTRQTRLGLWLRRFSLDELPQLLNILNGSMSLVGPRPARSEEADAYSDEQRRRLLVKPGLIGLWQTSGQSWQSRNAQIRLDLKYVDHWSLALDLRILGRTLAAVIRELAAVIHRDDAR